MNSQENVLLQKETDRAEEMRVLNNTAYERVRINPEEAYTLACTVQEFFKKSGNWQERGKSLITMGVAKCMMNDAEQGETHFLEARALFQEIGDRIGEARALHSLANLARQIRENELAIEYCETALALCNTGKEQNAAVTIPLRVSILNNMGMTYKELGAWQRALECYKQAEHLLEDIHEGDEKNRERIRQVTLNNIGGLLHTIGDVTGAMECYVQCLHIVRQWNNPIEELELLHNLGNLCRHLKNIPDAIRYCQRSLEIAEPTGVVRYMVYPLMNLGAVLIEAGDVNAAAPYLEKALLLAQEMGDKVIEARVLLDSVPLYQHTGQLDKATTAVEQARDIYNEINDYQGELIALLLLSEQYITAEQATKALPWLQKALAMAEQLQSRLYILRACCGLSAVYKQLGNFEQALAYHERYHAVEKEVFNEESDKKVQALMVQVQMERTEHERELYRSKAELLEQEVEFKRRELASHALHLVERDKLIRTTERFLEKLQGAVSAEEAVELKKVLRMLKNSRQDTPGWDVFDEKFQELHGEFTGRLTSLYPSLSPSEVKVCVLTKLHLSTKEIAAVLHTGVRTVEAHRYRLRKKLSLDGEVNLVSWLSAL